MSLTVYHLKTCDSCRKAIKALVGADHEVQTVDVRADGVPAKTLQAWVKKWGWETVLNRRSTTWRNLDDANKINVSDQKAVALMAEHPTLIKRPIIESPDQSTIGWTKETQALWL